MLAGEGGAGGDEGGAAGKSLVLVSVRFEPGGCIGPHARTGSLAQTVESGQRGFTPCEPGDGASDPSRTPPSSLRCDSLNLIVYYAINLRSNLLRMFHIS